MTKRIFLMTALLLTWVANLTAQEWQLVWSDEFDRGK